MSEKYPMLNFSYIKLKNWKNFADVHTQIQTRAFLVGPNASGKSNFLDAFRFLRDIAIRGGGLQQAVSKRRGVSALRSLSARRYSDIELSVKIADGSDANRCKWEYLISFNQDNQRRPIIKKERVIKEDNIILDRPDEDDQNDIMRLTQTHLEQVNMNLRFRELVNFFSSIRYLHIVPQLIREPDRSIGKENDPFGGDFLEQLAKTPEKTRRSRLHRIREALKISVPQLTDIELYRDNRGIPHLRGKYEHWRPQGAWQTEEQFSDGTLRLMGLLWALMEGSGPLLLEEPELSLHVEVIRRLPQIFARIYRRSRRQIILSTHSSELLRDEDISSDEVLLFLPSHNGTAIQQAHNNKQINELLKNGFSVADAVVPATQPNKIDQLSLFPDF